MRLIINGDDFGITHGCNLALIDCYQKGLMTSTSIMTNMPFALEAVSLSKENPGLSVGLHFCLTAGKPLTNVPSLIKEDGTFDKAILFTPGKASIEEMRQEMQAQYDKFVRLMGKKPDHLNSHHGIEQIAGGEELLEEFSNRYSIPIRSFVNRDEFFKYSVPFEVAQGRLLSWKGVSPSDGIEVITNLFSKKDIQSDRAYELGAHPGYIDYDLIKVSTLTTGRAYDAYFFMHPELKEWISKNNIELITYKDLKSFYD
ncbi:MAG: ChbG/HpnK family deacetylase [Allobaculum sp.]|nr:ChbG/HpnK family deacetylase [Allobaculum sp.]